MRKITAESLLSWNLCWINVEYVKRTCAPLIEVQRFYLYPRKACSAFIFYSAANVLLLSKWWVLISRSFTFSLYQKYAEGAGLLSVTQKNALGLGVFAAWGLGKGILSFLFSRFALLGSLFSSVFLFLLALQKQRCAHTSSNHLSFLWRKGSRCQKQFISKHKDKGLPCRFKSQQYWTWTYGNGWKFGHLSWRI